MSHIEQVLKEREKTIENLKIELGVRFEKICKLQNRLDIANGKIKELSKLSYDYLEENHLINYN